MRDESRWRWQVEFKWGWRDEPDHLGACWRARYGPGTTGAYRAVDADSGTIVWGPRRHTNRTPTDSEST